MSEVLTLAAEMREELGRGATRALRRTGMVPATIYGAGKEPMSISIEEKELTKYYRTPQYISQVIQFEIGQKKFKVLPKAIDLHPTIEIVRHADFVFLEKKIQKMEVPVVYINKENFLGIKRGGYFNAAKRTLTLLCPVDNLPRKIEVDITDMAISTSLMAKEVTLPEGVTLVCDPEFVIASIIGKRGKSSDLDDETTEGGEAASTEGEAAKTEAK
jgi:large subunit ribosomal protein L25